jgi:hypothetical protein
VVLWIVVIVVVVVVVVVPCHVVVAYQYCEGPYCLHLQGEGKWMYIQPVYAEG